MKEVYFVAGTDTGVGKTRVSEVLIKTALNAGLSVAALKPVAAGGKLTADGVRNEDALQLGRAINIKLSYEELNPCVLREPLSPHIAAARAGVTLVAQDIAAACLPALNKQADFTIVEGAGGWRVPLNDRETMADLVHALQIPVILVVGMRLGCLNHALLTAESIAADGLEMVGWVANCIDPDMEAYRENLETLKAQLAAPLIGEVPYLPHPDSEISTAWLKLASFKTSA